jgi:hypothetical protein
MCGCDPDLLAVGNWMGECEVDLLLVGNCAGGFELDLLGVTLRVFVIWILWSGKLVWM